MNAGKRTKLESTGFRVGSAQEFLGLSDEEMALIDVKVRLVRMLRPAREAAGVTQGELAARIGSSQSRVGKMEAASPDVSLDLICKALLALGVTRQRIGRAIAANRAA
ncbi:MAG TPA: helix-turn-helix transcriptional regulator [Tepidisphaeraceae bacterium]|jgi:DNA-binding XRE family transcriptional regulator|nr:helix-turn-helix transcriptional regulator [Tepidisphaeraceae bacterium]